MADQDQPPKLGATFLPGGLDDFYMPAAPDVVSPAPQRTMAELPGQIQQGLATLELEASPLPPRANSVASFTPPTHTTLPDFSLFPTVTQRTPNVPPPDSEKEAVLENARAGVLGSSDPDVQLMWANDTLTYVDISAEYDRRMSFLFGTRPSTPPVELQMRADAVSIVEFLAGQRHPRAEFMKGMWLEFGKFGYREDKPEAFRTYKRAAEKGYARAEYRMGMLFESTHQSLEALQHYKAGERAGDSAACYRLGMTHLLGQLGQPEDFPVAVQLIKHSADHADENAPQGAYVYGMLLANELPQVTVPATILQPDPAAARIYLERSAFLGFSKAQAKIGSAYELCSLGCPFSPALSLHYNRLAARQGEPEAEMAISKWFLCGSTGIFSKNEATAYHFAERAASDGLDMAEFAMGYFNEIGISCPINIDTALSWYRKAAAQGNKDASARIDALGLSKKNTLSKKDHEKVALERIRSTHASKRGSRPERLANVGQQMPPVPNFPAAQNHDRKPSGSLPIPPINQTRPASTQSFAPPRSTSVAPYPLDDRPASVAPYLLNDRPATAAPYPIGDSVRPIAPARDSVSAYTSAAQRPVSVAVDGRSALRPQSGMPQPIPAAVERVTGHRKPSDTPPARPPKERLAPAEHQYGNPADLRKAARTPDFGGRPVMKTPERTPPQARQQRVSPGKPVSSAGGPGNPRPSGTPLISAGALDSRRPSATNVPSVGTSDNRRPSGTPIPLAGSRLGAQKPATAATTRPPGRGPQTFEQMGIPAGKGDSDCAIM